MKIKKLANSNIEFLTDSDELIAVMQQIGAQLIVNAEGVKIIQTGYPEFYIKTEDVVSTQLMPAAAIAFTGDTTALVALLSASFFVLTSENIAYDPTGTGLTATTVQDAITELATEWTEVEIDITSAEILAMGTTPVELLAAPGVGKYYEYQGAAEYSFLTAAYTLQVADAIGITNAYGGGAGDFTGAWFNSTWAANGVFQFSSNSPDITAVGGPATITLTGATATNEAVVMTTWSTVDPAAGSGTFKVKLKYKIITVG